VPLAWSLQVKNGELDHPRIFNFEYSKFSKKHDKLITQFVYKKLAQKSYSLKWEISSDLGIPRETMKQK